jgi:hypothetical protein
MDTLGLSQTKEVLADALDSPGSFDESISEIMQSMEEEALSNLKLQNATQTLLPVDHWHDPKRLRSDISSLMPGLVYASLPVIAQKHLVDAGQLLTDKQETAAAALLILCVESTLQDFHGLVTGEDEPGKDWFTL